MIVPDSPCRKSVRAVALVVLGCLLAACGTTISGQPVASRGPAATTPYVDGGLARLLPDSSQFPSGYPAVVLPNDIASQAASDLDGILPGAQVEPGACIPLAPTAGPVVSVGTDDDTRATLTVELVRTDQPLSKLRDQLQRCGTVRAGLGGTTATITTELDPPPPLDADDTLALRRTVSSESGGAGLTRKMQSLVGQIGDVRINVTYMSYSDGRADAEALDSLFTTALSKVRKG
ncbi:sensor domain-containing protein [Nocardia sp. NPDC127526]|uniref:sensor domain-containing protein n=1 Tax=Nocardia sp. NPDC127526 TaxID=3345393 RepID=UPI00363E4398